MLEPFATASPPAAVISSTTPCAALPPPAGDPSRPTPMSLTTTRAPSAANAKACARPIPPPAPVTMTTRPSTSPMLVTPLLDRAGVRGGQIVRRLAPAVYLQRGTADVGRRIRGQKRCGPTDIGRGGHPAERHVLRDRGDRLGVAVEQVGLLGFDHAHHAGVHPDLGPPFHRQRLREALQAGLGRPVRAGAGGWPPAAETADVDDRPAALLVLHLLIGALRNQQRTNQIEFDDLAVELRAGLRGQYVRRPSRIVDDDIEAAVFVDDRVDHRLDGLLVADVAGVELVGQALDRAPRTSHHGGTLLGED